MSQDSIETIEARLDKLSEQMDSLMKLLKGEDFKTPGLVVSTEQRLNTIEGKFKIMNRVMIGIGSGILALLFEQIKVFIERL